MLDNGSGISAVLAAILLPERRQRTPGPRAAAHPAVRATAHASAPARCIARSCILYKARSRQYRNEMLQVKTRWN